MTTAAVAGILAGALALVAELLVFAAHDRPLAPETRMLRLVAAANVGGLAILGFTIAVLSVALGGDLPVAIAFATVALIAGGAFLVGLTFRRHAASGPVDPAARSRTMVGMAAFQGLGVIGAIAGILRLFLGS